MNSTNKQQLKKKALELLNSIYTSKTKLEKMCLELNNPKLSKLELYNLNSLINLERTSLGRTTGYYYQTLCELGRITNKTTLEESFNNWGKDKYMVDVIKDNVRRKLTYVTEDI